MTGHLGAEVSGTAWRRVPVLGDNMVLVPDTAGSAPERDLGPSTTVLLL